MKKLLFSLLAASLFVACTPKSDEAQSVDVSGRWTFVTAYDEPIAEGEEEVALQFNVADSTLSGSTGCNMLTGIVNVDAETQTISFERIGITQMLCADMESEEQVLAVLHETTNFDVQGDTLYLRNPEETVAKLVRAE